MSWLDAQAEGIALMLVAGVLGIAILLLALAIEVWRAGPMRRRRRLRAAYTRYCEAIDAEARRLAAHCWRGPEARP